jgi:hypothetical protein
MMTRLVLSSACVAFSLCILVACGREPSPEERIVALIAQAEEGAEARDVSEVMALVSERYSDVRGQDKAAIRDLMRGYFVLNQSIHLLTRIEEVKFPAANFATARVVVGMLGRQAVATDDWSLAADVYEFDIRLLDEDGEWRLQSADWHRSAE